MEFTVGLNTFSKVSTSKQCSTELVFKQWILVLKQPPKTNYSVSVWSCVARKGQSSSVDQDELLLRPCYFWELAYFYNESGHYV